MGCDDQLWDFSAVPPARDTLARRPWQALAARDSPPLLQAARFWRALTIFIKLG